MFICCSCPMWEICYTRRVLTTYTHCNFHDMAGHRLRCMTWNVRGLNDRVKRSLVCQFLKRHVPDVVCLQETHLTGSKVLSLRKPWVGWSYHSTFTNSSRGVSVLIRKQLHFKLLEQVVDDSGRYVILRCLIMFKPLILIAVYVPPPAN